MANIRTFVAVDITERIRSSAGRVISNLSAQCVDYNWVEKENLHVTLNFLGDVPDVEIPKVCRAISDSVQNTESFEISVRGLGCFPIPEKPRIVWLGIEQGTESLVDLNGKIADALEVMRFPRERNEYRPHLTLGRIRRGGRWNQAITDAVNMQRNVEFGVAPVNEIVVYSSFLDKTGPTYTAMSRIALC